jgi:hypothetical protein
MSILSTALNALLQGAAEFFGSLNEAPAGYSLHRRGPKRPMTEERWLACQTPRDLYSHVRYNTKYRRAAVRRQFLLYTCGCCRQVWHLLGDDSKAAVEMVERYAEGVVRRSELTHAFGLAMAAEIRLRDLQTVAGLKPPDEATGPEEARRALWGAHALAASAASLAAGARVPSCAFYGPSLARQAASLVAPSQRKAFREHGRRQANLLRCVFGDPFRPIWFDPAWQTPNVQAIARCILDEGRFDEVPILGDALEEAGCADKQLLTHCRTAPHARGCHVVDAIVRGTPA